MTFFFSLINSKRIDTHRSHKFATRSSARSRPVLPGRVASVCFFQKYQRRTRARREAKPLRLFTPLQAVKTLNTCAQKNAPVKKCATVDVADKLCQKAVHNPRRRRRGGGGGGAGYHLSTADTLRRCGEISPGVLLFWVLRVCRRVRSRPRPPPRTPASASACLAGVCPARSVLPYFLHGKRTKANKQQET